MEKKRITTFSQSVSYLYNIPKFVAKNSTKDTRDFLDILEHPEEKMRIIHVAGTNGKGSVCTYMRNILETAGYTCAVFTSPHLIDIRERFLVCGKIVSQDDFLEAFLKIYGLVGDERLRRDYHPSFFEFLFFMSLILFSRKDGTAKTDYVILETGLGGRLDATNSVSKKVLSIITEIGFDHMEYLGDTKEKIAREKAGIIANKVPVVYLENSTTIDEIIKKVAKEKESPCFSLSKKDYVFSKFKNKSIDFSYFSRYYECIRLRVHTTAFYQMENAALAVLGIEVLLGPLKITKTQIEEGIEKAQWEGRMEEIYPNVYVDGAHNEDGIQAFLSSVARDQCQGKRYLLFSAVSDKEYERMIELLIKSNLFEYVAFTEMENGRTLTKEVLKSLAYRFEGINIQWEESCKKALETLLEDRNQEDYIYIAGSLYLVGEVKQAMRQGVSND